MKLTSRDTTSWLNTQDERDDMLHGRNCPPCDGLCKSGRVCPAREPREPGIDWVTLGAIVCVLWADLMYVLRKVFRSRSRTQFRRKWLHWMSDDAGYSVLALALIGVLVLFLVGLVVWMVMP